MLDPPGETALDLSLLRGFRYACRPECGLCCFTTPRVAPRESVLLLQIAPEAEFFHGEGGEYLASRPDGGACQFLTERRCAVHAARPHPCREFPVSVHLGVRAQASLVLSCPGIDLAALGVARPDGQGEVSPDFHTELESVRGRLDVSAERRRQGAERRRRRVVRRLEAEGRWEPEEDVRACLRLDPPLPGEGDFPVEDPPTAEDGAELLPLFFDGRSGPVALAAGLGGWELRGVAAAGGVSAPLGVVPPPERPPEISEEATTLLRGYLRYWLERDCLFGWVHLRMLEKTAGTVTEWTRAELRAIGALTLARADVRARFDGAAVGELSAADILRGIRATDQDLLDRESWGERL